LPAIDGLQITGEAFPGRELQASGYSINGTTSCNFEVRLVPQLSTDSNSFVFTNPFPALYCIIPISVFLRFSFCAYSGYAIWMMDQ
jgi:hypothetical protein